MPRATPLVAVDFVLRRSRIVAVVADDLLVDDAGCCTDNMLGRQQRRRQKILEDLATTAAQTRRRRRHNNIRRPWLIYAMFEEYMDYGPFYVVCLYRGLPTTRDGDFALLIEVPQRNKRNREERMKRE